MTHTDNGLREALARAYPSGDEDLAKNPEAWAFADAVLPTVRRYAAEELERAVAILTDLAMERNDGALEDILSSLADDARKLRA